MPPPAPSSARLPLPDGLRGLASLWVALFHIHGVGAAGAALAAGLPVVVLAAIGQGDLGVAIFFVLSGFVIALSVEGAEVDLRYVGSFALRRAVRLDPPYWATLALAIALLALGSGPVPSWGTVAAHVVYLQDLLRLGDVVFVFWTLCLELQFYLVLVLLLHVAHRLGPVGPAGGVAGGVPGAEAAGVAAAGVAAAARAHRVRLAVLALPAVAALVWPFQRALVVPGLFLSHWYMFLLGSLVFWAIGARAYRVPLALFALVLGALAIAHADRGAAAALATGTLLFVAGRAGTMGRWLASRPLQYAGRVSYSLYLLHAVIGTRLMALAPEAARGSFLPALAWFALSVALTLAAAHALHVALERPCTGWSRRLRGRLEAGRAKAAPAPGFSPAARAVVGAALRPGLESGRETR